MSIVKRPRLTPVTPKDILKRIPTDPGDIGVSVSIPTSVVTDKGRGIKMTKIVLVAKKNGKP
jgi:hypothetical protein